jgi:hypothetical protein
MNTRKKHSFVADSSGEETALGYDVRGDSGGEVRAFWAVGMVTHGVILLERLTSRYAFTARRGR